MSQDYVRIQLNYLIKKKLKTAAVSISGFNRMFCTYESSALEIKIYRHVYKNILLKILWLVSKFIFLEEPMKTASELLHKLFTSWWGSAEVSEIFKRNRVECKNVYSVMKAGDWKLMLDTPARAAAPIPSVWQSGVGATQFTVNRRSFLLNRRVNGPVLSIAGYVTAGSAQGRRITVNCFNQLFELQHDGTCWLTHDLTCAVHDLHIELICIVNVYWASIIWNTTVYKYLVLYKLMHNIGLSCFYFDYQIS